MFKAGRDVPRSCPADHDSIENPWKCPFTLWTQADVDRNNNSIFILTAVWHSSATRDHGITREWSDKHPTVSR